MVDQQTIGALDRNGRGRRPSRRAGLLAALLLLCALPAAAQSLRIRADSLGLPGESATSELHLPSGAGPHPAVVLLHGCSGVTPTVRRWAAWLAQWGYAALVLDSFTPRGVDNVCGEAGRVAPGTRTDAAARVPPRIRAGDAFAAAAYLRTRPDIQPGRIAAVGFSHGGSTGLVVALRSTVARLAAQPFSAVVAFYPWCPLAGPPIASPVLILIGDADDWTPAERCQQRQADWRPEDGSTALHVYPGATHAFDSPARERVYFGHRIRHDAEATTDAARRLREFLEAARP
ncbi:dienelactone hydrolase family protein [Muricoccus radiodurans]|uniref:dienelactone hydrolase family protein n=1 Tax=Muricoccus radiodurans TaxID=2231721 RepID=UPI003CF8E2E2